MKKWLIRHLLKTKILDINVENEKVSLGIKQLTEDKFTSELENIKLGDTVTCLINKISENNIEVSIGDNIKGNIKKSDLSRDRKEQRTDRFGIGDKVDATVIKIDKKQRSVNLSIKAREIEEEKQHGKTKKCKNKKKCRQMSTKCSLLLTTRILPLENQTVNLR